VCKRENESGAKNHQIHHESRDYCSILTLPERIPNEIKFRTSFCEVALVFALLPTIELELALKYCPATAM